MDTVFLQSYVTVVECGSLAEAARRLDITPATLAARLRTLEQDLGVVLVRRSGRVVKPTEGGLRLLDQARELLLDIHSFRTNAAMRKEAPRLRLGAFISSTTTMLPAILKGLSSSHPDVSVFVDSGYSPELSTRVASGELDAALVVEHYFAIPKACEWIPLADDRLVLVAPVEFMREDAHAMLRRHPYIRYDRRVWGGRLADRYLQEHGLQPRVLVEINGMAAITAMVKLGMGLSLLPDWAPMWAAAPTLQRIPVQGAGGSRRLGIVRSTGGPRTALIDDFVAMAAEVCRREPSNGGG